MSVKVNKQCGRIEQRTLLTSVQLNEYLECPHVAQVFRIERVVYHAHQLRKSRQIEFGLTSLSPERANPDKLLAVFREYLKIENSLHYRRDVTLREDQTRFTDGKVAHKMAILNNLVIGLCLSSGYSNLASVRRYFDAHPKTALEMLISSNIPAL